MATNDRNYCCDIQFLSHSYTEGFKKFSNNSRLPMELEVPKAILEERAKSWESLFEKYSVEITDAAELNLKTMQPIIDTKVEFVPERRIPLRNSPSCIQYWVDTGKAPCLVYIDQNYNSDSETSLSESEISAPLPAAPPPLGDNTPHPPQPANVPQEVITSGLSIVSTDSVNTRDYILSSNIAKKKQSLAISEGVKSPQKVVETNVKIEDTYVDVCGTDELPKIAERESQSTNINSVNSQNTTIIYPFPTSQDSAIMRVASGSLKLGDVIPSLQGIRDGPENYNVSDVYSDKLPSHKSDSLIVFERSRTPSPKFVEPVNGIKDFHRRKLFTNHSSPTELIAPSNHGLRKMSSITLHPALQQFDLVQHPRKSKKKSLFRKKSQLEDIEGNEQVKSNSNEVKKLDSKENDEDKNKDKIHQNEGKTSDHDVLPSVKKRAKRRTVRKTFPSFEKVCEDDCLKKRPIVRLTQISDSFIKRNSRKSVGKKTNKKSKRVSFKTTEKKKAMDTDAKKVNGEFNKNELKFRDLIVSLERLPVVMIERLSQKRVNTRKSLKSASRKTSTVISANEIPCKEQTTDPEKSNSNGINKSLETSEKKCITFVDSEDEESPDQKSRSELRKSFSIRKQLTKKHTIIFSSDEESSSDGKRIKENSITSNLKIGINRPENVRQSTKVVFTISSDEDDDISKFFENNLFVKSSKSYADNSKTNKNTPNGSHTGSFPFEELHINGFKSKINNLPNKITSNKSKINLEQQNSKFDVDDKEKKEMLNSKLCKFNTFENGDSRRLSRFVLASSTDSSDSDEKKEVSNQEAKPLEKKLSKRKSSNTKTKSKNTKNLLNTTKISTQKSNLDSLQGKDSDSSDDSQTILKYRSGSSLVTENPKLYLKKSETENSKKIELFKKKLGRSFFNNDSDSDSMEIFDLPKRKLSSNAKGETKTNQLTEAKSSKRKSSHKKLSIKLVKPNEQTTNEISKSLKRFSNMNKRKKSRFSGSISSESEESQSDTEFQEKRQAKKIRFFENSEKKDIQILQQSSRVRKEIEDTNSSQNIFDDNSIEGLSNIFGNNQSRDSSPNIFDFSQSSSDDENVLNLKFNKRLQKKERVSNFVNKEESQMKVHIFRTKSYWESDSD